MGSTRLGEATIRTRTSAQAWSAVNTTLFERPRSGPTDGMRLKT